MDTVTTEASTRSASRQMQAACWPVAAPPLLEKGVTRAQSPPVSSELLALRETARDLEFRLHQHEASMDLLRTFDAAVLICIAVCNGNRAGSTHAELLQVAFDHRSSCLCLFDTNNKLQLPPACPYRRGNNCLRQCACCFLCLRQSH